MAQAPTKPDGPPYGPMDARSTLDKAKSLPGWILQQNANAVSAATGHPMNLTNRDEFLGSQEEPTGKKRGGKTKKNRGGKVHGAKSQPRLDRALRKSGGEC